MPPAQIFPLPGVSVDVSRRFAILHFIHFFLFQMDLLKYPGIFKHKYIKVGRKASSLQRGLNMLVQISWAMWWRKAFATNFIPKKTIF